MLGVGVRAVKLMCFLYSAALAGLAGALLSLAVGYLAPDSFSPPELVTLFAMVAVGGFGTIAGPSWARCSSRRCRNCSWPPEHHAPSCFRRRCW